jgi:hypothetical protein
VPSPLEVPALAISGDVSYRSRWTCFAERQHQSCEPWYDTDDESAAADSTNYRNSAFSRAPVLFDGTNATPIGDDHHRSDGTNSFTAPLASRRHRLYWQGMVTWTAAADYVVSSSTTSTD